MATGRCWRAHKYGWFATVCLNIVWRQNSLKFEFTTQRSYFTCVVHSVWKYAKQARKSRQEEERNYPDNNYQIA